MTPEQQQIVFYGIEAVVMLFGLYALYEWGLHLIARLKAATITHSKAQTFFSIPAMLLSFVPFAILMIFMRAQADDAAKLFDVAEAGTIFLMFGLMFSGFIIQGIAIGIFWYSTRAYKK